MKRYDELALSSPALAATIDSEELYTAGAVAIAAYAAALDIGTAAYRNCDDILRTVAPRILNDWRRLALYGAMAEGDLRSGDVAGAIGTMMKIAKGLTVLPADEASDRLRSTMLRLAMQTQDIPTETLVTWAMQIDRPELRIMAFRAVSAVRLAQRRINKQLFALSAVKDPVERTRGLTAAVAEYSRGHRFATALNAAALIEDRFTADRDNMMQLVFEQQRAINHRPDSIYAPLLVRDEARRDRLVAELAIYSLVRGRSSQARSAALRLRDPRNRSRVWSAIATFHAEKGEGALWAQSWDLARSSATILDKPERSAAVLPLALQAARRGDVARAEGISTDIDSGAGRADVAAALAIASAAAGNLQDAEARTRALPPGVQQSAAAAGLYRAFALRGAFDDAKRVEPMLATAEALTGARTADAAFFGGAPGRPAPDAVRSERALSTAETQATAIEDKVARDQAMLQIAQVHARRGAVDRVASLIRSLKAPDAKAQSSGLMSRALVMADRDAEAWAALSRTDPSIRDRELSSGASALIERHMWEKALDWSLKISSQKVRLRTLRGLAEAQADARRREFAGAPLDEQSADPFDPLDASGDVAEERFVARPVQVSRIGRRLPSAPDVSGVTGNAIRAMIPAPAPGKAHVIPTGFSNINERFSYIRYLNSVDLTGGEEQLFASGQRTYFPRFILIESGVFDLPALASQLRDAGEAADYITANGRVYQLNVPLLVGPGATLVVSDDDVQELRLNAKSGAYIVNSGAFYLVGSRLTSWDPTTNQTTRGRKDDWSTFNPFYVGWSGSETYIAQAHVNGLGYGNGKSYGLTVSSGPESIVTATAGTLPQPRGVIVDSLFSDMYFGFYSYEASDVKVVGNQYLNNEIYALDPHDRSSNLTFAYNTTGGTKYKHGIILSRDVHSSVVFGNVSHDNAGSGVMLDRRSSDNYVGYNFALRNKGDGLTLYESPCNIVARNRFSSNGRDGVKIRNTWDVLLAENEVGDNRGIGVNAYSAKLEGAEGQESRDFGLDPYSPYVNLVAVRNLVRDNTEAAFRTEGVSVATLAGNRLTGTSKMAAPSSSMAEINPSMMAMGSSGVSIRDRCQSPKRIEVACDFNRKELLKPYVVAPLEALGGARPSACDPPPSAQNLGPPLLSHTASAAPFSMDHR